MEKTLQPPTNKFNLTWGQEKEKKKTKGFNALNHENLSLYNN